MNTDAPATRATAGKALLIFIAVMLALTLFGNTLQNMVVPIVTPTYPQRGSLEMRINASGALEAASTVPVLMPTSARIVEVFVKSGAKVAAGDALLLVDYTDALSDKHKSLMDALGTASQKQQAYDWEVADIPRDALRTLETRREALIEAEDALFAAQLALDNAIESGSSESAIDRARETLASAQELADARKRSLEQLSNVRSYINAVRDVESARSSLDSAARAYFDLLERIDGAESLDRDALIESALRSLQFTGSAGGIIPFDSNEPHLSTVRASASGEVTSISATLGEVSTADRPVLNIGAIKGGLTLTVTVSSDEASLMEIGDYADLDLGDDRVNAPIISKQISASDSSRYDIGFEIPEGYGSIGLQASMRFRKRTQSYDVLIPLSALRSDSDGDFVYVITQQEGSLGASMSVQRVDVYVIDQDSTRAALQGGVSQRDVLVMRSNRNISNGDRVRLDGD